MPSIWADREGVSTWARRTRMSWSVMSGSFNLRARTSETRSAGRIGMRNEPGKDKKRKNESSTLKKRRTEWRSPKNLPS